MKRLFLLASIMFGLLPASAQMKVLSFSHLENDMTANRFGTSKTDMNGETAALIKIVTPETGFTFDGGAIPIVAVEYKAGEIWLYVPRRSQRLTISHSAFGVLRNYIYPVPIEGGRTYEMFIDLGIGRYVTITSEQARSTIYIDGEPVGESPVLNRYLQYGRHTIRALKDRYEGEQTVVVSANDEQEHLVVNIPQRDMSDHFGDVTVSVDGNADILFEGRKVGSGSWQTQLREGNYTVETQKADCDPQKTSFTVVAQRQNDIRAAAPIPHTGRLSVYVRPLHVVTSPYDLSETVTLPVGTHQVEFQRKGYVTERHEYTISRGETTRDTVTLQRVKYVRPLAFYFGGGYTVRSLSGLTGIIGAVFQRNDLQAFYTFGASQSDPIHCYDTSDNYLSTISFKQSSFGLKYGYQFNLMEQLAITPQLGVSVDRLSGKVEQGTNLYADGASATCATLGVKLLYAPMQHFYLFAAPEFAVAVQKDDNFTRLADASNIQAGGFAATLGVIVNF